MLFLISTALKYTSYEGPSFTKAAQFDVIIIIIIIIIIIMIVIEVKGFFAVMKQL